MDDYKGMYIELLKTCLTASCYDESSWSIIERWDKGDVPLIRPLAFAKDLARRQIFEHLSDNDFVLMLRHPFDKEARNEGKDWPSIGYSMAGHKRMDNTQFCIEEVVRNGVPGDLVETGVWRGGMTILMAAVLKAAGDTERKIWAADSFEGLPVPKSKSDGADLSNVQYLKASLEDVKANFARFGLLTDRVEFIKGWFCDTLPTAPIERIAVLRLDGDLYTSTMDALSNLYHKVSAGGYVIIDDYGAWPECKAAVTDFLKENHLDPEIQMADWAGAFWKVEQTLQAPAAKATGEGVTT